MVGRMDGAVLPTVLTPSWDNRSLTLFFAPAYNPCEKALSTLRKKGADDLALGPGSD